jgi:epoxide hydrolase-like predicted phosphatase
LPAREGLLVDFGGVLTTNVFDSFAAFCREEGLPEHHVRDAFRTSPEPRALLFDLELGRLDVPTFERRLAAAIGLAPERAPGMARRLFARAAPDEAMLAAVAAARRAGVRTGLISNSWGDAIHYDRDRFPELFDGWVISHEVGLRKPDPEIYVLGAERIGLPPERCVFVDDLGGNLKPARALGMATVKHVDADTTIAQLEELLGVPLRAGAA